MVIMKNGPITVRKYIQMNLRAAVSSIYDDGNYRIGRSALSLADGAFEIMNCQFENERYKMHTFGQLIDFYNRLNAIEEDLKELEAKNE